jgi:hypothetical protein
MSKREMARVTQEIQQDLLAHGLSQVQVDVDAKGIAYVSGNVANRDAEADAVATVLQHEVSQVQDGMVRPGQVVPDLVRSGHLGPYTHMHAPTNDPARQILGAAHTEERVFNSSVGENTLQTGTPLTTGKDGG